MVNVLEGTVPFHSLNCIPLKITQLPQILPQENAFFKNPILTAFFKRNQLGFCDAMHALRSKHKGAYF